MNLSRIPGDDRKMSDGYRENETIPHASLPESYRTTKNPRRIRDLTVR